MIYIIAPYESVGKIRLGVSRGDARRDLNSTWIAEGEKDCYMELGLFLYFDAAERCEAIEMAFPAEPRLFGISLIGSDASKVLNELRVHDNSPVIDETGATFFELGVGIYAPFFLKNSTGPIEAVIAFRHGYYA